MGRLGSYTWIVLAQKLQVVFVIHHSGSDPEGEKGHRGFRTEQEQTGMINRDNSYLFRMNVQNWSRILLVLAWLGLLSWGWGGRGEVFFSSLAYAQVNQDCVANTCSGSVPANATSCNSTLPAGDLTAYSYSATCGATACTFSCNANYSWSAGSCVLYACGVLPAGATACNANTPLIEGQGYAHVAACGSAPCTYACTAPNYTWDGAKCCGPSPNYAFTGGSCKPSCGAYVMDHGYTLAGARGCALASESYPDQFSATGETWDCAKCFHYRPNQCNGEFPPINATLCAGSNVGVSGVVINKAVAACTGGKCEYNCNAPQYVLSGLACGPAGCSAVTNGVAGSLCTMAAGNSGQTVTGACDQSGTCSAVCK